MPYDFERELAIELSLEAQSNPPRKDQSPSERTTSQVRQIIHQLLQNAEVADVSRQAKTGNLQAENLIDAYKILLHRDDSVARSFFIAAYNDWSDQSVHKNQEINEPEVRDWIDQQLPHFDKDSNALDPAISYSPWQYLSDDPTHSYNTHVVWSSNGPGYGAVCSLASPGLLYSADQWLTIKANGSLIAHTPELATLLHKTQGAILQMEQSILRRTERHSDDLFALSDLLDDSLRQISSPYSTPGPWIYCPDGAHLFNDNAIWTSKGPGHGTVAEVGSSGLRYNSSQWREMSANAKLISSAPEIVSHLQKSQVAIVTAAQYLANDKRYSALPVLHAQALINDPLLSHVRGQHLNPHLEKPIPALPGFRLWLKSHAEAVDAAQILLNRPSRPDQRRCSIHEPDRQSGICHGLMLGETTHFYLQFRTFDSVYAHWKHGFREPLLPNHQYSISYRDNRPAVRDHTRDDNSKATHLGR